FAPLERGLHLLPGIDVDGFLREVRDLDPKATRVTPDYGEDLVVPGEDARGGLFRSRRWPAPSISKLTIAV
ncbi:MAG: hypothetical protein ABIP39_15350, partial [Polyangiaceae bacterium]